MARAVVSESRAIPRAVRASSDVGESRLPRERSERGSARAFLSPDAMEIVRGMTERVKRAKESVVTRVGVNAARSEGSCPE